tara:strand:+ start:373 stop:816 length:444 start_codon:yes stop_codon:yes gene_type:complete
MFATYGNYKQLFHLFHLRFVFDSLSLLTGRKQSQYLTKLQIKMTIENNSIPCGCGNQKAFWLRDEIGFTVEYYACECCHEGRLAKWKRNDSNFDNESGTYEHRDETYSTFRFDTDENAWLPIEWGNSYLTYDSQKAICESINGKELS